MDAPQHHVQVETHTHTLSPSRPLSFCLCSLSFDSPSVSLSASACLFVGSLSVSTSLILPIHLSVLRLCLRIVKFPNTLNVEDTRKAISIAFTKWSDVSPLTFAEITDGNATADITIGRRSSNRHRTTKTGRGGLMCVCVLGFYTFNHTDCWWSPLHPCFDGLNGELAHAFLPPRGEIHFDNHEFWILGKSRFSWKQGTSTAADR